MNCLAICAFSFLMSQHAEGRFYSANAWYLCPTYLLATGRTVNDVISKLYACCRDSMHRVLKFLTWLAKNLTFPLGDHRQIISQMIEIYQFSRLFAVSQKRWGQKITLILSNTRYQNSLKWLWNDMKANSLTGFQNVDSNRVVFLE